MSGRVEEVLVRLLLSDRCLVHLPLEARELPVDLAAQRRVDVRGLFEVRSCVGEVLELEVHHPPPVERLDVFGVVQEHLVEVLQGVLVRAALDLAQRHVEQQRALVLLAEPVVARVLAGLVEVFGLHDVEEVRALGEDRLGAPQAPGLEELVASLLARLAALDFLLDPHVDARAAANEVLLPDLELDRVREQVMGAVAAQRVDRHVREAVLAAHARRPQLVRARVSHGEVDALGELAVAALVLALPPLAHLRPPRAVVRAEETGPHARLAELRRHGLGEA
mmetsp:Transcript_8314/g.33662  ORF Transcript_8314/g.33662 Transcript_8314/m.33662 type:complete len:280 (-) Transcript_8314:727-1566(-)